MRAYTEHLVRTCHKRGAHAIGGMAAYIPNRKNPEINDMAMTRVRDDKLRESKDGFDGIWVAHPDLVRLAQEVFQNALSSQPNQKGRLREGVKVSAGQLLDFNIPGGVITEAGLRTNINVGIQYIESWLRGAGAAALFNLMEDAATAEISRAQVWQWLHSPTGKLEDGRQVEARLVKGLIAEEMRKIEAQWGEEHFSAGKFGTARSIFEELVFSDRFAPFLTLVAYPYLD
jgi:malate synthase